MNTRIQVEHPVTEMITGVDLIHEHLRIASGLAISFNEVNLFGYAIECSVNAENPSENFKPCVGTVDFIHFPGGYNNRVDSAIYN